MRLHKKRLLRFQLLIQLHVLALPESTAYKPTTMRLDDYSFVDCPEHHDMSLTMYLSKLRKLRENLRLYMSRNFSIESVERHPLGDAPYLLKTYMDCELRVLGFKSTLCERLKFEVMRPVLRAWGFCVDGGKINYKDDTLTIRMCFDPDEIQYETLIPPELLPRY
jgi:hypothetical protein